jgi:hypothetical protein
VNDISIRIRSALERSRAAWSMRNHDEDALIMGSIAARERARSQFSMSLAVLITAHVFWSPSAQRMFSRSISCDPSDAFKPARGRPALPQDAFYVNTYAHPAKFVDFQADLHDAILLNAAA